MSKHILVPLDGSDISDRILLHVRRILHREDTRVTFLHVGESGQHVNDARDRFLREGAQAESRTVPGDPASGILAVAREIGASLIAMSTHGRTGIARFVRGSVAERVLQSSLAPLLLANPMGLSGVEELRIRRILVPLDGSELSAEILPAAEEMARLYGSEIVLFHAVDLSLFRSPISLTRASAEAVLYRFRKRIEGVPAGVRVTEGSAAEAILDVARDQHVDLIAMTTHGHSGPSRWSYGSVAEQVLRHCPCPLLVKRTTSLGIPGDVLETASAR